MTAHPLQKYHISASLQHYVNGGRVKRKGVGPISLLLLCREEKCSQTEADGCTACDQLPSDRTQCAVVTFPLAPHPSCIQSTVSGCYIQFIYSLYCVWTKLQPAPQLSHRSPTRNVNNLPIYSTGRDDTDPPALWFIHKHSRLL